DNGEGGEQAMVEVYETRLTADHWTDREGKDLPIGKLSVEEDEVLDPESLKDVVPEEQYEGYTGNEGMTLERWYRHAAIVLWPEARHSLILCDNDGQKVVPVLEERVMAWRQAGSSKGPALKAQCLDLAAAILAS